MTQIPNYHRWDRIEGAYDNINIPSGSVRTPSIVIGDKALLRVNSVDNVSLLQHRMTIVSGSDFDVQVDWDISPSANNGIGGWGMFLEARYISDNNNRLRIYQSGANTNYIEQTYKLGVLEQSAVANNDTTGKFRIIRTGNDWQGYYWNGSSWSQIGSTTDIGEDVVEIRIYMQNWTVKPDVWGYFDNFILNSGYYTCPASSSSSSSSTSISSSSSSTSDSSSSISSSSDSSSSSSSSYSISISSSSSSSESSSSSSESSSSSSTSSSSSSSSTTYIFTTTFTEASTEADWVQEYNPIMTTITDLVQTIDSNNRCDGVDLRNTSTVQSIESWSVPGSGSTGDIEVLTLFRPNYPDRAGVILGGSKNVYSRNGHIVYLINQQYIYYRVLDNGTSYDRTNVSFNYSMGDEIFLRVKKQGTSFKVKAWKFDESEPVSWNIDFSETTYDKDGWVGVYNIGSISYDYFAVNNRGTITLQIPACASSSSSSVSLSSSSVSSSSSSSESSSSTSSSSTSSG